MAVNLPYTKVGPFVGNRLPSLGPTNLNIVEAGIDGGQHITGLESDRTTALATAHPNALMFCTDSGFAYVSQGSSGWLRVGAGDAAWTTPTLGGTYATSSTAQTAGESIVQYRRDGSGFVHVVGYIDTGFAAGTPIFTFPVGYRPLKTRRFFAPTGGTVTGDASSSKAAFVLVKADGTVNWNGEGSTFITLDGIVFLAEQ